MLADCDVSSSMSAPLSIRSPLKSPSSGPGPRAKCCPRRKWLVARNRSSWRPLVVSDHHAYDVGHHVVERGGESETSQRITGDGKRNATPQPVVRHADRIGAGPAIDVELGPNSTSRSESADSEVVVFMTSRSIRLIPAAA